MDGQLPLVVGGEGNTPFIEIPTAEGNMTVVATANGTTTSNDRNINTNSSNNDRSNS